MENSVNLNIFRAYDVRGIFGDDLTVEIMLNIGRAFGTFILRNNFDKITVGGDIRASTPVCLQAFVSGALSTGLDIELVDTSPLGVALFNSFAKKIAASAFITASHLPPEWNGVKFYWGEGIGFSPDQNNEVKKIFETRDFISVNGFELGKITHVDPYPEFVSYLKTKFKFKKKLKIAIDSGNGSTAIVIPDLFKELGLDVISIFDTPDPRFPNRPSEPNEESLKQLSELVKKNKVDFAAGFDGDGDRCVIVDETGIILSADAFGLIVADHLLNETENKNILINMECSIVMEKYLKEKGANVKRIRVGHSFLSMEAKQTNAVFGIEASGHAIVPSIFLFDDALILPLVFAKSIENSMETVSKLAAKIKLPIKKRFDLDCSDNKKFEIVKTLINYFENQPGETNNLDGVSLSNDDGRILVRASNTSPLVRVTIESITQEGFNNLQKKYLPLIKDEVKKME